MSPDVLSGNQASEDFAAFKNLLENGYGGFRYFRSQGTDWDKLFRRYRKKIRRQKPWTLVAFFSLLDGLFREAKVVDNHLLLTARSENSSLWSAPARSQWKVAFADYLARQSGEKILLVARSSPTALGRVVKEIEGQSPESFLFPTFVPGMEGRVFLVGSFAERPLESLRVRFAGSPEDEVLVLHEGRIQASERRGGAFSLETVDGIPVVAVHSLNTGYAAELERFVETARELRKEKVIILDLRGCAGGSNEYSIRWLQGLTSGTVNTEIVKEWRQSLVEQVGAVNRWRKALLSARDEAGRAAIRDYLDRAQERLEIAERTEMGPRWNPQEYSFTGSAEAEFAGTLIVLSDRRNASAGESSINAARGLRSVVVLGENSAGVNSFSPINYYQLPNSRIGIQMGEAVNFFGEEVFEGKGVPPDFWVDQADALPLAVSYAKKILSGLATADEINKNGSGSPELRGRRSASGNCEFVGSVGAHGSDEHGRTHAGYRFDEDCNPIPLDEGPLRALDGQERRPVESRGASSTLERHGEDR